MLGASRCNTHFLSLHDTRQADLKCGQWASSKYRSRHRQWPCTQAKYGGGAEVHRRLGAGRLAPLGCHHAAGRHSLAWPGHRRLADPPRGGSHPCRLVPFIQSFNQFLIGWVVELMRKAIRSNCFGQLIIYLELPSQLTFSFDLYVDRRQHITVSEKKSLYFFIDGHIHAILAVSYWVSL